MRTTLTTAMLLCAMAAAPAFADTISDLTFSLNPTSGSGKPLSINPVSCPQTNCVLFSGTLTDTDNDVQALNILLFDLYVVFSSTPASGMLSVDNTFSNDVPGQLTGDPNWATDQNEFSGAYTGPIFGINIAPGTTAGVYKGIAYIDACGGAMDSNCDGFTVASQEFTVSVISPEPSADTLLIAGFLPFAAWFAAGRFGLKKWRSPESLH